MTDPYEASYLARENGTRLNFDMSDDSDDEGMVNITINNTIINEYCRDAMELLLTIKNNKLTENNYKNLYNNI